MDKTLAESAVDLPIATRRRWRDDAKGVLHIMRKSGSQSMSWLVCAILSAFFASLVAIFGKIGIQGVDSNLAVAIRCLIIVFFAWGIVALQGNAAGIFKIGQRSMLFIVLSALATGLSWMFYYKALQLGEASKVAPVDKLSVALTIVLALAILGERPTPGKLLGGALVTAGVLVTALLH
jgi:transporter family protein